MRVALSAVLCVAGVSALGLPVVAHAASPVKGQASFTVRQALPAKSELRGSVRFAQPAGWRRTAGGDRHSYVRFRVVEGECELDLTVSLRGVATGQSVRAQVEKAVGDAPLGRGARPGGAWGTDGPTIAGGEGGSSATGLYGIAPIRVAAKRYGQLRIMGTVRGCDGGSEDATTLFDPKGSVVGQVNRVLKTATTTLRLTRVD